MYFYLCICLCIYLIIIILLLLLFFKVAIPLADGVEFFMEHQRSSAAVMFFGNTWAKSTINGQCLVWTYQSAISKCSQWEYEKLVRWLDNTRLVWARGPCAVQWAEQQGN